ncbi:MAG: hypothetical protein CME06_00235 [Gemmatimonadetes bacterium]|nr:hypothetical protein [Gemmatimonadota bacterium]
MHRQLTKMGAVAGVIVLAGCGESGSKADEDARMPEVEHAATVTPAADESALIRSANAAEPAEPAKTEPKGVAPKKSSPAADEKMSKDVERYLGLLKEVETLLNTEKNAQAVAKGKVLVKEAPEEHEAWLSLGVAQRHNGDLAGAEVSLKKADALEPKCGKTLTHLAQAVADQGRCKDAIPFYEQAGEATPEVTVIWMGLLECQQEIGDKKGAAATQTRLDKMMSESKKKGT